jgi:hypothetical protein
MNWINSRQFQISNRNGRHYVFRRNNAGNTEINIPLNITTKAQAVAWLKAHPDKVANPTRYKAKRGAVKPSEVKLKPFERMINGKKMIAFVNKEGKEYFRPAPPTPRKKVSLKPLPRGIKAWKYLAPPSYNLTSCASLQKETSKFPMKVIGKGRQGVVLLASRYTNGRDPFAIKVAPWDLHSARVSDPQPADVEFKIQNAAMKAAPDGVVKVYQILACPGFISPTKIDMKNVQDDNKYDKYRQKVITMEFAPNGNMQKWLDGSHTDTEVRKAISKVLLTLKAIKDMYPHFSHNDLHLENVFMTARGPLIGDFGWARLERNGTNPAVNRANGTNTANIWGVGPKTDVRYDHHLFLNQIRDLLTRHGGVAKYPETIKFLNMAVPEGYRGKSDVHVSEWRLKYEDPCDNLPSLSRLVKSSYVTGVKRRITSPNLEAARRRLRKVAVKRKSTSPPKKKQYTNAQLLVLPAADFLKLSPATMMRVKALRAAAKGKGPTGRNNKPKGLNATGRKATEALGGLVADKKKHKPFPREILKLAKFNKMVTKVYESQNKKANESFNNAWNRARRNVINKIQARINNNKPPFTPSPPKKAKSPSPPKKAKSPSPTKKAPNFRLSPSSGRAKIQSKNTGRWVYANLQSMNYLKDLAALMKVNIKGLRSKANVSKKLFSR